MVPYRVMDPCWLAFVSWKTVVYVWVAACLWDFPKSINKLQNMLEDGQVSKRMGKDGG